MDTDRITTDILLTTTAVFLVTVMSDRMIHPYVKESVIPSYAVFGLTRIAGCIVISGLIWYFHKSLSSVGVSYATFARGIQRGILYSLAFAVCALTGFVILWFAGIPDPTRLVHSRLPATPIDTIFFFITGGLLAPILEELFFRGVVFGYFKRWGVITAVIISTAIFAGVHQMRGGIPIPQIVGGIVFAIAYHREKSLMVPIIIHSSGNIAIFTLSLL